MKAIRTLLPLVAGLFIVLTYLLMEGLAPSAERHERSLDSLRSVMLYNAALQRDVLRARAGILRNYDPLVHSIDNLHEAAANLAAARDIASDDAIDPKVVELIAAVRDQEAVIETFKSNNALLQNSLTYFNHTSARMATGDDGPEAANIALLTAAAMLGFVNDPDPDAASEVNALLDRLARLPDSDAPGTDVNALIAHGRLIVRSLPGVDALVVHLQAAPTNEIARVLQDAYLGDLQRAADRAGVFQAFLYAVALALVAYIAYLFIRLRASAQSLRERLKFEELIASISAQFINLPRDRLTVEVTKGLERLSDYSGLDAAQIVVHHAGKADFASSFSYQKAGTDVPDGLLEEVDALASNWKLAGYERQGYICVPEVLSLPDGREKAFLQARGVRSWLCIPIWYSGQQLGFLTLDATAGRKDWLNSEIARLRTAAEIFANAIARVRNETERETLQTRLNQSQRLEAIGTLAGGIAHEFNNILGAVLGYSEIALAVLGENPPARRHVQQIMKAGERAQEVVEQILAFGRRRDREHRPMRVEPIVEEAVELLRASLPATLSIRTHLAAGDASMIGDPTELQQVVLNLGANGSQAMDGRGSLTLELDTVEPKKPLALSHGSLAAGRYIRLVVGDSGHGMDQATMERIFEPFFTTKSVGRGTGLGLSTVHGIVTEHGGAIDVASRKGEGTTFTVYFPRVEGAAAVEHKAAETSIRGGKGETILIVDDDTALVRLGEEMLAALGYEPVGF